MSYTLIVCMKDGKAVVESASGDLPDGEIEITANAYSGSHRYPSINVTWRDGNGQYLIHTAHTSHSDDDRIWPDALTAASR